MITQERNLWPFSAADKFLVISFILYVSCTDDSSLYGKGDGDALSGGAR